MPFTRGAKTPSLLARERRSTDGAPAVLEPSNFVKYVPATAGVKVPNLVLNFQSAAASIPLSRIVPKLMKVRSTATMFPALSRMTRPGNELSLSTTNWVEMGKEIAFSIRDDQRVIDTLRSRPSRGDQTKPSVLDVLVVG